MVAVCLRESTTSSRGAAFRLDYLCRSEEPNRLNLGIHFDSNDMAAILANTTIRLNSSLNSMFDITVRLSRDSYLTVDYSINRGIFYKGNKL